MDIKKFFSIIFLLFLFDQLIKYYVDTVRPSFGLFHYVENTGAAFGLFQGSNFVLSMLTLIVVMVILYMYFFKPEYFASTYVSLSAALILGGAFGNLADRVIHGFVIDYIDFGFFPVFNLADIALSVGVIVLVFCLWNE